MNVQDLRNELNKTYDKLSVFLNIEYLSKYELTDEELLDLINEFLTESEKLQLIEDQNFSRLGEKLRVELIKQIADANIKFKLLQNDKVTKRTIFI